jgi:predicted DNA-binding transcriptional regulator YafY
MPGEGYRLMEGYYLPPVSFTPDEARALSLAVSMLVGFATPGKTKTAAADALEKIRAVLPKATLRQVEALQAILRVYAIPGPPLDFDDPMFSRLQEAIQQRRVVHLQYHARRSNKVTERDVEPVELILLDRAWLLSAYCRLRQAPRAFRLDRIDKLVVRQEQFTPRQLGDRTSLRGGVRVVVQFDASITRWVREQQHFTFVTEETSPSSAGSTVMIYHPRSFRQIEGWLLSWGDKMTVLEPAELRQRLSETAARILAHHQKPLS